MSAIKPTLELNERLHDQIGSFARITSSTATEGSAADFRKGVNRDHPRTVLLLVSTCCHEALVRPFLNVSKLLASEGVRVVALLTDGNCCSFFSKLRAPAQQRCDGYRASTLETLRDAGLCVVPLSTISYDPAADPRMSHLVQVETSTLVAQYASHPLWKTIRATVSRHCDWDRVPDGTALLNW